MATVAEKACTRCGVVKPAVEFPPRLGGRSKNGLQSACRVCLKPTPEQRAINRRRYEGVSCEYVPKAETRRLAAEKKAAAAARREAAAVAKAIADAAPKVWAGVGSKAWYASASQAEIEAYRLAARDGYRKRCAERGDAERERVRIYKHANPEAVKKWQGKRAQRAAERSDGTLTESVARKMLRDAKECLYCDAPLNVRNRTLDHMTPIALGGAHSAFNVVACCRSCNSRKSGMAFDQWVATLPPDNARRAQATYRRRHGADPQQGGLILTFQHKADARDCPTAG